jgi:negative regulator of flagellin synthesis FlgM
VANRINQLDGGAVSSGTGGAVESILPPKPAGSAANGSSGGSAPESDSVHITASGRALAVLSQAVQEAPEMDSARVSALQQAISSGTYSVDAEHLAGSMLQLEQDLGGSAQ